MAGIEVEGMDEVLRRLGGLKDKGQRAENAALRRAGDVVQESIQSEAPEQTGKLKELIVRTGVRTKDGMKHVLVEPKPKSERSHIARFLEFGTVKMRANPFMSRGYEKAKGAAQAALADELRKGLGL